jgi:DNA-binding response OmpR family regulator
MSIAKKVLIADDEPNILLSLDFLMKKSGYQVFIARDGAEAQEIIRNQKPDIAILDIMMPEIDGYQLCQYIKSQQEYQHTKIIFLTAKSQKADVEKGLAMGADKYITKPFSTKSLMQEVANLLK